MSQENQGSYEFGPFRLDPAQQQLFEEGKPVPLTPKAFDTLLVLVQKHGQLVSKEELLQTVWPDAFVEEATLAQNVFRLRKLLANGVAGTSYIETIPKRGYRFVAEVHSLQSAGPAAPQNAGAAREATAFRENRSKTARLAVGVVACLLVGAAAFALWRGRGRFVDLSETKTIRSLAVLPLENISRDPEQEYFADGLTEALITDLAKIGSVRVVSRTSVMQYKGVHKALPQIAQELGVDAVVEGTVLRAGDQIRITAQLIRARNERHLWAEMYERNLGDALTVQGQIAGAVAEQIRLQLSSKEQAQISRPQPVDPEAYDLYLRGRYYWNKRDPAGLKKSFEYFQRSLEKDPKFALGYAGIADYYIGVVDYFPSTADAFVPAREATLKALQLDENLAEAHAALGFVHFQYDWAWEDAEKEFRSSIELSPGYATAHHWYGEFLAAMGRCDESLREYRTAVQSDPMAMMIRTDMAAAFAWCRQIDPAIDELHRVLEMSPDFARAHLYLAMGYAVKAMCRDAMTEYQRGMRLTGGTAERYVTAFEAFLDVRCGKPEEAHRILKQLRAAAPGRSLDYYMVAQVDVGLGDLEAAFRDLAKAEQQHTSLMVLLKIDQWLDPLRPDPRFQALLQRMKLV